MFQADVIIIGSGVAALQLAKHLGTNKNVMILTKSKVQNGNSYLAQGGVAAALSKADHPFNHYQDTLEAGRYMNDHKLVYEMTMQAPKLIRELTADGCDFDRTSEGELMLGLEGAHSHERIVHGGGDATGQVLMDFFTQKQNLLTVHEGIYVYELIITRNRCVGVKAKNQANETVYYYAPHVVIATGGVGQLYLHTSNAETVCGDGIALAYRAGAKIRDMEFIQFHPTLLYAGGKCRGLISEAVRGQGARLVLEDGTGIMDHIHPLKDLAPRHVVAKRLHDCIIQTKQVYLDISSIPDFARKFPTITQLCLKNGVDLHKGLIPVMPGCHFLMGGILTDHDGRTSVEGLYAIGEAACTGVHGANRLASNSLLEGLFIGKKLAHHILQQKNSQADVLEETEVETAELPDLPEREEIKRRMMSHVGIVRDKETLKKQLHWLEMFHIPQLLNGSIDHLCPDEMTTIYMLVTSWLITRSALLREESRGGHFRADFPFEDDHWLKEKVTLQHQSLGGYYEQVEARVFT